MQSKNVPSRARNNMRNTFATAINGRSYLSVITHFITSTSFSVKMNCNGKSAIFCHFPSVRLSLVLSLNFRCLTTFLLSRVSRDEQRHFLQCHSRGTLIYIYIFRPTSVPSVILVKRFWQLQSNLISRKDKTDIKLYVVTSQLDIK